MTFKDLWWLMLLRGIVLVLFGFAAIGWPAITFVTLAFLFAFYILISGVMNIIHALMGMKTHRYWFLTLVLGVIEIGVGAYALNNPAVNISALVLLIGLTFIVRGVLETISAFDVIFEGTTRALILITGVLGIVAGFLILRYPVTGTLAFTWIMGLYALIAGSIVIALAVMAREVVEEMLPKSASPRRRRR